MSVWLKNVFIAALLVFAAFFMTSCVTEKVDMKRWKAHKPIKANYPEVKNYRLALFPIGKTQFKAGEKSQLSLCLKNINSRLVRIDEWFMNEPDNIKLYYRPFDNKITKFSPDSGWTCIAPEYRKDANRFQLVLYPRNNVIVNKDLPFVKNSTPGQWKRYMVVAELTLKSVSVRSKIFSVVAE
jgi:hypothetical protein